MPVANLMQRTKAAINSLAGLTGFQLVRTETVRQLTGIAAESPAAADDYVETAVRIFKDIGARNDLAQAMVTWAALRQAAGDTATARQLLDDASMIFRELGTRGEPARVGAALAALDRGFPIRLLDNLDIQFPALRGGSA